MPAAGAGEAPRYERIGRAAFALARRVCGDDAVAAAVVERAFADVPDAGAGAGDGLLLRRVRELACTAQVRRLEVQVTPSAAPGQLGALPGVQWRVLDLVALRGVAPREAGARLGLAEAEVLAHLRDGLRTTRALLAAGGSGAREADDDADAPRLALLG
jgi:DNA-directed RNA polymerase specialized sigma24 family protein